MTQKNISEQGAQAAYDKLKALFNDRASTSHAVREHHSHGEGWPDSHMPDMVIFAQTTEEVSQIIKIAHDHNIPVIPFGTGTSLEGHVNAVHGGITIDLTKMDTILEVNNEDLDCRVQAGVTREQLNDYIRDTGLFFPIDPGANASIGGMASTRASGTNAVRYGTMKENILGLTVVTATGEIIKTGGRAKKSSAGYDLTRLFIGAEGTLGVITEIQVKLYGIPETISSAVCQFPDLESAINTTILAIQSGIPVARIELLDDIQMRASILYSKLEGFEEKPTLFFEFHGTENTATECAESMKYVCDEFGGSDFKWATLAEDRNHLWEARHKAYWAARALAPEKSGLATDACVPISNLADCLLETKKDVEDNNLTAPIVGHVGDGNFHLSVLVDQNNPDEIKKAKGLIERLNYRAIDAGGTCTGEHGVGLGKKKYLAREHGAEALFVMKQIKQALDPKNIMNPGKILDLN